MDGAGGGCKVLLPGRPSRRGSRGSGEDRIGPRVQERGSRSPRHGTHPSRWDLEGVGSRGRTAITIGKARWGGVVGVGGIHHKLLRVVHHEGAANRLRGHSGTPWGCLIR